jgi:hypothetical protein
MLGLKTQLETFVPRNLASTERLLLSAHCEVLVLSLPLRVIVAFMGIYFLSAFLALLFSVPLFSAVLSLAVTPWCTTPRRAWICVSGEQFALAHGFAFSILIPGPLLWGIVLFLAMTAWLTFSINYLAAKDDNKKRLWALAQGVYLVVLVNIVLFLQHYGYVMRDTDRPDHGLSEDARSIFNLVWVNLTMVCGAIVAAPTFNIVSMKTRDLVLASISHDMRYTHK